MLICHLVLGSYLEFLIWFLVLIWSLSFGSWFLIIKAHCLLHHPHCHLRTLSCLASSLLHDLIQIGFIIPDCLSFFSDRRYETYHVFSQLLFHISVPDGTIAIFFFVFPDDLGLAYELHQHEQILDIIRFWGIRSGRTRICLSLHDFFSEVLIAV